MINIFLVSLLFTTLSGGSVFAQDASSRKELNRNLTVVQVAQCEGLAKKLVKKLKSQGLTDEQIITAFANEIAANVDGEQDEKSFFSSKLTFIVGGVIVTGLAAFAVYWLCKSKQNTGSIAGAGCPDILTFSPGYQPTSAERVAIDRLRQDLETNRQNVAELNRLTQEFRRVHPVSQTGVISYNMSWAEPVEYRDQDGTILATGSTNRSRDQRF